MQLTLICYTNILFFVANISDTLMRENELAQILSKIGLSENEAAVYLAALSLGATGALQIARQTTIKRATVYNVITALQQKGLMNIEVKGFKKRFVAERPEKLEFLLNHQRELLQSALPDLTSLYDLKGEEGTIRYYEGLNAVKTVYESLLKDVKAHDDYLILSDLSQWLNLDEKYFLDFLRRRAKLPLNIRMMAVDSDIARQHKKIEKTFNEAIRILPPGTKLSTNLVVIPKKVVIHQLTEPVFAIVIENPNIVRMHREQFEIMWKALE